MTSVGRIRNRWGSLTTRFHESEIDRLTPPITRCIWASTGWAQARASKTPTSRMVRVRPPGNGLTARITDTKLIARTLLCRHHGFVDQSCNTAMRAISTCAKYLGQLNEIGFGTLDNREILVLCGQHVELRDLIGHDGDQRPEASGRAHPQAEGWVESALRHMFGLACAHTHRYATRQAELIGKICTMSPTASMSSSTRYPSRGLVTTISSSVPTSRRVPCSM